MRTQRQEWIDFLDAIPYFDDVTLLPENKKEIASDIAVGLGPLNAKGGKTGIVVVFFTVTASPAEDGGHGPVLEFVHGCRVLENPVVNTTGKNYEAVAEAIAAATHGQFRPLTGGSPFILERPGISLGSDPKYPSKDLLFRCSGHIGDTLPKVATPTVEISGGQWTLDCQTPGASIFYTVSGAAPSPRSGLLYLWEPVPAPPGQTIKARAWLAGYLASDIVRFTT